MDYEALVGVGLEELQACSDESEFARLRSSVLENVALLETEIRSTVEVSRGRKAKKKRKQRLAELKRRIETISSAFSVRAASTTAEDERASLLEGGRALELVERSGDAIDRSAKTLEEMEAVATGIRENLRENAETLGRVAGKVGHTDDVSRSSNAVLNTMISRNQRTKTVLYGGLGVVALVLLVGLYFVLKGE